MTVMLTIVPSKLDERVIRHINTACIFFCDKLAGRGRSFHVASTFLLNKKVKGCATDLKDTRLFAKLSLGDMLGPILIIFLPVLCDSNI